MAVVNHAHCKMKNGRGKSNTGDGTRIHHMKNPDDGTERHHMENPDDGTGRHQMENPDYGTDVFCNERASRSFRKENLPWYITPISKRKMARILSARKRSKNFCWLEC
jgi:hypothetical protein